MKFQIRPCTDHDFEAVFRLLGQLWPDRELYRHALPKIFQRALCSAAQVYLCGEVADKVVGFVSLNLGHIDELIVDEKHRECSFGTQLLNEIIAHARRRGCERVELDSAFHRKTAHEFYRRRGFENRAYLFSKSLC